MIKTNLPVLLLRGIILLPHNELRLEFDNDSSKNLIDLSELFHDSNILVVNTLDVLEEKPDLSSLPKIGIESTIKNKIELPNGNLRITLVGKKRVFVNDYLSVEGESLESIISNIEEDNILIDEEKIYKRKIHTEMEKYIKLVPYVSNSVLSLMRNAKSLSELTDIIVPNIGLSIERLYEYMITTNVIKRCEMLLSDIYKEENMYEVEKEIDNKVKNGIEQTQKEFILKEKIKTIKKELNEDESSYDELKNRIDNLKCKKNIKTRLYKELNRYQSLPESSQEISNVRNYIEYLLDLPWLTSTKDNDNLNDIESILNESHFGLDDVKTRIIEFIAVKKMKKNLNGPIICLVGPPGVGKTTLAFSIANALNRKFVKISVGGLSDEAELVGHRRTYLGANPGRIIQQIKKAKSNNPVFLIDEIDKMTKDYKGDPASALLDILDHEQNKMFSDNYIEEEFDLSNVLFITTANSIETIPDALRDRLEIIDISGYTELEKLEISKNYLIKKTSLEVGLKENSIKYDDDVILTIIRNYTRESGVRELQRQFECIARKIVTTLIKNNLTIKEANVTKEDLIKYLGNHKYNYLSKSKSSIGVVNGLAYTRFGGDTLSIEVNFYKGNGNLILTGSLGEVIKESASVALSYIKSNYKKFNIDFEIFKNNDIHIHAIDTSTKKDGPSAGIAITTALISALSNLKISDKIAFTGEISLRGNILPIGGLEEKAIGAYRNNIKTIFIPKENKSDLEEIPKEILNKIKFKLVSNYDEVYSYLKKGDKDE